jgi:thiol-disulfide isomerase/thioredoxin
VSLVLQSWDQTQQLVAAHRGKVVVLDLWATSCAPCRREFPALVRLQQAHRDKVACISYSMDYSGRADRPPEFYRDKVHSFLAEQHAEFQNVLSIDDPDALHARLKLAAIPAVYVYDSSGTLRQRFDNEDPDRDEFTYDKDVIPLVLSLLAEG